MGKLGKNTIHTYNTYVPNTIIHKSDFLSMSGYFFYHNTRCANDECLHQKYINGLLCSPLNNLVVLLLMNISLRKNHTSKSST